MAKLLVTLQGVTLREVRLSEDATTLGRRSRNHVVMNNLGVSGEHAVIRHCGTVFYIEDLGSTNGTLVNGEPIRSRVLRPGDRIEIGEYRLTFVADSDADAPDSNAVLGSTALLASSSFDPSPRTIQNRPPGPSNENSAANWPRLRIRSGANAGREYLLRKVLTRIGRPGRGTAVITRSAAGYSIEHHRGDCYPRVNGDDIGSAAHPLANNDLIEVAGVTLEFIDRSASAVPAQRPQGQFEPGQATATAKADPAPVAPIVLARGGTAAESPSPTPAPSSRAATDRLRNLLNIRTERAIPKRGPRPNPGARIVRENLRMTVQAGMSNELWRWLQDGGWREVTYRPDRRHYCEVPSDSVAELIECGAEDRTAVLESSIERAKQGHLPFLAALIEPSR